jgi:hypothetical protein
MALEEHGQQRDVPDISARGSLHSTPLGQSLVRRGTVARHCKDTDSASDELRLFQQIRHECNIQESPLMVLMRLGRLTRLPRTPKTYLLVMISLDAGAIGLAKRLPLSRLLNTTGIRGPF